MLTAFNKQIEFTQKILHIYYHQLISPKTKIQTSILFFEMLLKLSGKISCLVQSRTR